MASPSVTQATRRRQRSTRLTVAVSLLVIAALVVAGAAISGSWLLVTGAAGLGVLLGAAATRITHSELAEARRDAAGDRARQAQDYLRLAATRDAEHASYVAGVEVTIADRETALRELEDALSSAQKRAATAQRKRNAEGRRSAGLALQLEVAEDAASQAHLRIAELEAEIMTVRAELESVTAAWRAADSVRKHA